MNALTVSAVVVTYNSAATIRRCLASLAEESRRLPLEVLVVDNDSRDDTLAAAGAELPAARRIAMGRNAGFAAGCNRGAQAASGELLFFLNPDAYLAPLALVELADSLARDPTAAIAGPRILASDGGVEPSFGTSTGLLAELRQSVLAGLDRRRFAPARAYLAWRSRRGRPVTWVSGAALLVRRDVYLGLGGMDEGFFLYFEDVDLCVRAGAAGARVLHCPRAAVHHERGASVRSLPGRVRVEYRKSQLRFYAKHASAESLALLRLYLRLRFTIARTRAVIASDGEAVAEARAVLAAVSG